MLESAIYARYSVDTRKQKAEVSASAFASQPVLAGLGVELQSNHITELFCPIRVTVSGHFSMLIEQKDRHHG